MSNQLNLIERLTGLFLSHYGSTIAAVKRYAPVSEGIEDILQQVYIEFLEGGIEEKWDLHKDVGPLLYQIAKRRAINSFRRLRKEKSCPIDLLTERLLSEPEENNDSLADTETQLRYLKHCLSELSPQSRAIVEQHYFSGVPMKEIASQQNRTEMAVYRLFFRIRTKLRDCINRQIDQEQPPIDHERSQSSSTRDRPDSASR